MQTPLISPNLHAVLIHYPLGILIAGVLIELFSFLWRRSSFRLAGRWMILIGAMSAIPATFSGIYALRDVTRISIDSNLHWSEIKATSVVLSKPGVWEMLRSHMLYQSIVTGVAALVVLVWLGASDAARQSLRLLLLAVLVADVGLMIAASHLGGQAVYTKGVAVEPVFPLNAPTTEPTTQPTDWTNTPTRAELMFPPLELHTTMAGVAIAIAIISIGLSFRKINATHHLADEPIVTGDPAAVSRSLRAPPTPPTSVEMVRTFNPALELETKPFAPAGRFWMLTFLIALVTFAGGLWVMARGSDILDKMRDQPASIPMLIWTQVRLDPTATDPTLKNYRSFTHFVAGSAIVVLPLVLALLARFAPRRKWLLSFFTLLLALAVTAQVWVGVLLMYDTGTGKLLYFYREPVVTAEP
jgi:uncharacterized membrane protein